MPATAIPGRWILSSNRRFLCIKVSLSVSEIICGPLRSYEDPPTSVERNGKVTEWTHKRPLTTIHHVLSGNFHKSHAQS